MNIAAATLAGHRRAFAHEAALTKALTALLRGEMRTGARRVESLGHQTPAEGELFPAGSADHHIDLVHRILHRVAVDVAEPIMAAKPVTAAVQPTPDESELAISFTAKNPLVRHLLDEFGLQITQITQAERRSIVQAVRDAYDAGLSILDAARSILTETTIQTELRATRIARTMLIGAANGASLAAVRMVDGAQTKSWKATEDARTRLDHADADGQTVPISQPFQVGGTAMQYPGDPTGPVDQCANCRCVIVYDQPNDGADLSLAAGGGTLPTTMEAALLPATHDYAGDGGACILCGMPMDDAMHTVEPMAAPTVQTAGLAGVAWQAVLALEGTPTADGRIFDVGALDWRTPPLTLYAQFENAEGHDDAPVAGRIDTITRTVQGSTAILSATGVFDSGDAGQMAARLVGDQTLNGISIDFAIHEAEIIDGPIGPDGQPGTGTLRITSATVLGATVLGMAAFDLAHIAITADAGHGTLVAPLHALLTRTIPAPLAEVVAAATQGVDSSIVASIMAAASQAITDVKEQARADRLQLIEVLQAEHRAGRDFSEAITAAVTATREPQPIHLHASPITVEAAPAPSVTVEPALVTVEPPAVHVDVAIPPQRPTRVLRDAENRIIGSEPVEEPVT